MARANQIELCYVLHDERGSFARYAGTSMLSAVQNTKFPIHIHLLHDGTLTDENRAMLQEMLEPYGAGLSFYDLSRWDAEAPAWYSELGLKELPVAWYRLLLPDLLPDSVGKALYFDAMVLVHADLSLLWELDLNGARIGAVPARHMTQGSVPGRYVLQEKLVSWEQYFQGDVMCMDLAGLRKEGSLLERCVAFWKQHPSCSGQVQDGLNGLLADSCMPLPPDCNLPVLLARQEGKEPVGGIYVYSGNALGVDLQEPFTALYFSYYRDTPWFRRDPERPQPFLDMALTAETYGQFAMEHHEACRLTDLYGKASDGDFYHVGPQLAAILQSQIAFLCRMLLQMDAEDGKKLHGEMAECAGYLPKSAAEVWACYRAGTGRLSERDMEGIGFFYPCVIACGTVRQQRRFTEMAKDLPAQVIYHLLRAFFQKEAWESAATLGASLEERGLEDAGVLYMRGVALYYLRDEKKSLGCLRRAKDMGCKEAEMDVYMRLNMDGKSV